MAKNRSHGTPEQFEQAVRHRIDELSGGVESATAITADTEESGLFADPNGIIGEAGELYTYQELKQMYEDGVQTDPWLASYPTFKSWYNQIVLGYLTRVSSEADLDDDDDALGPWEFLGSKQVMDSDGFWTDYTLWVNRETGMYVCIFGDNDLYTPENSSPDFETESEFEAYEWFDDYDTGELEGEDDIYNEIHGATNTCGIAAKPITGADVLYVDDGGMLGEPGAQYNYDELYAMFVDNWDDDPVMEDYDSFDAWFKDTKPYLRIVNAASKIDADLSEVPDVTEVVIEGSEDIKDYLHSLLDGVQKEVETTIEVNDIYRRGRKIVCKFEDELGIHTLSFDLDELSMNIEDDVPYISNSLMESYYM